MKDDNFIGGNLGKKPHNRTFLFFVFLSLSQSGCYMEVASISTPTPSPAPISDGPTEDLGAGDPTLATGGKGGALGRRRGSCAGRDYLLYAPKAYSDAVPTKLVAAFHGLGDTYENFMAGVEYSGWLSLAEQKNFLLLVPEHTNPGRPSFIHFQGSAPDLEATIDEMESVSDCIRSHIGKSYNIDLTGVYWMGFSEGAAFSGLAASVLSGELAAVILYGGAATIQARYIGEKTPLAFVTGTLLISS